MTGGMISKRRRAGQARCQQMGLRMVSGGHASENMAARSGGDGRNRAGGGQEATLAGWAGAGQRDSHWVVGWEGRAPALGREWQGAQSSQGATELVFSGPALGKMQGEAAGGTGDASSQGEEASSEGLGGYQLLAQTDAPRPAGQRASIQSNVYWLIKDETSHGCYAGGQTAVREVRHPWFRRNMRSGYHRKIETIWSG